MVGGGDSGPGQEERAYRAQRRERLHQIRGHLREMEDHLRELDDHLRHEEEESERWHGKWDDPVDGG